MMDTLASHMVLHQTIKLSSAKYRINSQLLFSSEECWVNVKICVEIFNISQMLVYKPVLRYRFLRCKKSSTSAFLLGRQELSAPTVPHYEEKGGQGKVREGREAEREG